MWGWLVALVVTLVAVGLVWYHRSRYVDAIKFADMAEKWDAALKLRTEQLDRALAALAARHAQEEHEDKQVAGAAAGRPDLASRMLNELR